MFPVIPPVPGPVPPILGGPIAPRWSGPGSRVADAAQLVNCPLQEKTILSLPWRSNCIVYVACGAGGNLTFVHALVRIYAVSAGGGRAEIGRGRVLTRPAFNLILSGVCARAATPFSADHIEITVVYGDIFNGVSGRTDQPVILTAEAWGLETGGGEAPPVTQQYGLLTAGGDVSGVVQKVESFVHDTLFTNTGGGDCWVWIFDDTQVATHLGSGIPDIPPLKVAVGETASWTPRHAYHMAKGIAWVGSTSAATCTSGITVVPYIEYN